MIPRPPVLLLSLWMASGGCGSSESKPAASPSGKSSSSKCHEGAEGDLRTAGRTAGAAAKTGVTAAADGVVQAGSATAGLFHGGKGEAKEKWKEGGKETKADARKNGAETKQAANGGPCD